MDARRSDMSIACFVASLSIIEKAALQAAVIGVLSGASKLEKNL